MDGQISLKEANAFVRKQFQGLMKRHGFLKNKRTGFYVRIQSGFVQIFILRFLRSLPQIECLLLPAFLYANGHLPYMEARYIRLKEQLDLKESIFFADIALPGPPGGYHLTQFERVWNANHRVLEELLIPYLDQLDFEKTLSLFQSGKNDFFQTMMGVSDDVACAAAVGLVKCARYEEGLARLLEIRDIYARAANTPSSSRILAQKNLEYIDDMLFFLQNKPDQWENNLSRRIAETELETFRLWTET